MGKWEENAAEQADWGEWVKGVESGRKWKPYDWAPLCYPQWWTDPSIEPNSHTPEGQRT